MSHHHLMIELRFSDAAIDDAQRDAVHRRAGNTPAK
jgi:hypothetical protein